MRRVAEDVLARGPEISVSVQESVDRWIRSLRSSSWEVIERARMSNGREASKIGVKMGIMGSPFPKITLIWVKLLR
ncbi:MAG: hypothetical protein QXU50_05655 [Candidatus Korarchaeum sp.]